MLAFRDEALEMGFRVANCIGAGHADHVESMLACLRVERGLDAA
jgi:hypothetical protein